MWWLASLAGALAVLTGALPLDAAIDVVQRVAPVLGFLVGITLVAELADAAGVFDVAARKAAHLGRGSVRRLWLLVVVLATLTTVVLSLDTTAVLLTPVVLAMAAQLDIPALPFAMTTVWLANTASLLLPVSNLTNLLAARHLDIPVHTYAGRMALPAAVAVGGTVVVLGLRYRRRLAGRYVVPADPGVPDRLLLWTAAAVCLAVGPLFVAGIDVTVVAVTGAAVLSGVFAVRRPRVLRLSLVPWRLVLLVLGLFFVVQALSRHGLEDALTSLAGTSGSTPGLVRVSATAAAGSNVANNLPAYVALEPVANGSTDRLLALLVGTNVGPLVLLWGSLATLLWRERCRARGLRVRASEFALVGLAGVPPLVLACVVALALG